MPEETLWCLGIWEQDTDYRLNDWDWDLLPQLFKQDNIRYEYNQANQSWSKVSCTIFSAMGMISDLMNYEFSLAELKEVDELSYTKWRTRGKWWYVKDAVDLSVKWWNEKHKDLWEIAYYRIWKSSDILEEVLAKWYTVNGNMCPTTEYSADYRRDAILDWYNFWKVTNWHAIDIINDWTRKIKDSYKGRKTYDGTKYCNRYELRHRIAELTNYWPYYYVCVKVKDDALEEVKRLNEFKSMLLTAIEHNSKLWHLTNDTKYKDFLHSTNEKHRAKIRDCEEQLKKHI